MGKLKYSLILASALVVSPLAAANAADLIPAPVPVPAPIPVPDCCGGAFYLKGFIGLSNQESDEFTNDIIEAGDFTIFNNEFDSAPFIGIGIGWEHSAHFRGDLTGEYRGRATFHGLDRNNTAQTSNDYSGTKSEWLFLANAYWDIATIRNVTPYVGAGIGVAEVTLSNFTDTNENTGGHHWASDNSEWNFAWAVHAGLAFDISDALKFDVGYRYVNFGDATTGTFQTYDGTVSPGPLELKDIDSHDVMVGLRWKWDDGACCETTAYAPPPYK